MRKCKCNSNYCLHNRKNSVDKIDDFLDTENGITINNRSRSPSPEYQNINRSRSPSPINKTYKSRSPSPEYQKIKDSVRSRNRSPSRKKYSKRACKHIMFKTAKALCNPKLRKKYAKIIVKKKKKCKK